MHFYHRVSLRGVYRPLLVAIALAALVVALGGCYPYYYDAHYSHSDGYYQRDYQGKRHYYGDSHRYHRDRYKRGRYKRDRWKRYRHYRHRW